ncbi:CAZyme family GH11 [Paecilomyces variotii]|nr:CAZyme family GH11 [Paecilomyces variotii]
MLFTYLLLGLSAATGLLAAPSDLLRRQSLTSSSTGTNNGFYYSFYTAGTSTVVYTNEENGEYNVTWSGDGDFVCGKGWNPGSAQAISYSAKYEPNGDSYLSVYGWTTDPLVEYYIVESWDGYDPSNGGSYKGTVSSDDGTYDIYESQRVNEPSIEGTATFNQYWSVRQSQRTSGTVTTSNHFNTWKELGLQLGTFNYQIVAVEAWSGNGAADVTVL